MRCMNVVIMMRNDCETVCECRKGQSYCVLWLFYLVVHECLRRGTLRVVGLVQQVDKWSNCD